MAVEIKLTKTYPVEKGGRNGMLSVPLDEENRRERKRVEHELVDLEGEPCMLLSMDEYAALRGPGIAMEPVDQMLVRHAVDELRRVADELEAELPARPGAEPEGIDLTVTVGSLPPEPPYGEVGSLIMQMPIAEAEAAGLYTGPSPVAVAEPHYGPPPVEMDAADSEAEAMSDDEEA